ncbi:hypothetical protein C8F01DRAFT_1163977, partial [Mycena amicta]
GEALPHQFSHCTYALGALRQAVYLCLTCPETRGFCAACSVACHTDHDQVELFPKRNFRCDCPTTAVAHPCALHSDREPPNTSNQYGQNFKNQFCRCGRPYDAKIERETMLQCLSCEDWFHESCCFLRQRPETAVEAEPPAEEEADDAASEASSSGLPPPLISASEYDAFVCRACVRTIPTLQRIVGTPGVMTVTRKDVHSPWAPLGGAPAEEPHSTGDKRPPSPTEAEPAAKRATRPCLAPAAVASVQAAYADDIVDWDAALCTGDAFLTEDFRTKWCRCDSCLPSLEAHSYLLEDEETYEPPEDPDSGLSLEELGMRALERLPRDRAIDGILAFNTMRDKLRSYLRPFAEAGKVVGEADVQSFFEELREANNT